MVKIYKTKSSKASVSGQDLNLIGTGIDQV